MGVQEVRIANAQEISRIMDERGIQLEDIKQAIAVGETTGRKFYRADLNDRFLTRAVIGKFNVYAEYSPINEQFIVYSAYAHRIMLAPYMKETEGEEPNERVETGWKCYLCEVAVEEVDDIHLVYHELELPHAIGYRCPVCGLQMLSETLVMTEMFLAEMMLEAK